MEVSFYLTRAEEGKQTAVYAHVRYSKNKFKYYLTEKIDPVFWNTAEQRVKKTNRFPGYMEFNRRLDKIQDKIRDLYNAYRNNHEGQEPAPDKFKALIDKELKGQSYSGHYTLIKFLEELRDSSLDGSRVQHKTGKPFNLGTIRAYTTAINHFKHYEQVRRRRIAFDDISIDFHADYTEFLIKYYKLSANSIGKDIKNIRMAMNEAFERGLHKNLQHKSRRFSVTREDVDSIYLNQKELDDMLALDLSASRRLEKVRDLFIVGCYTGLRFSDLSALRPEHIDEDFIRITQTKTGDDVAIPVHPVVRSILVKYEGRLPKAISNRKTNDYLKEIGQQLPCLQVNVSQSFTKGGMKVTETCPKWQLLGTHTGRRSFASREYLAGMPTLTIMAVTGHKTEKAFMKYIKLTPTEHAQKMKDLWASRNQLKAI